MGPLAMVTLPCEDGPVFLGPDLRLPEKDDGEAAVHALAHGPRPACAVLCDALALLLDDPAHEPLVWRLANPGDVVSVRRRLGRGTADLASALAGASEAVAAGRSVDGAGLVGLHWALSDVLLHLPGQAVRYLAAALVQRHSEPAAWAEAPPTVRNDVTGIVRGALQPIARRPADVDPWSLGECTDAAVRVPPSWIATVWAVGAEVIEGCATLALRPTPDGVRATARLVDRCGVERTVVVRRSEGAWVVCR